LVSFIIFTCSSIFFEGTIGACFLLAEGFANGLHIKRSLIPLGFGQRPIMRYRYFILVTYHRQNTPFRLDKSANNRAPQANSQKRAAGNKLSKCAWHKPQGIVKFLNEIREALEKFKYQPLQSTGP